MFNEYKKNNYDNNNNNNNNSNNNHNQNGNTSIIKGKYKIEIDKKEEDEFVSKQKLNAPMLILAHHKKNRNKDIKLKNDGWQTFFDKCVGAGYRVQNIVFEWDYEIWMIKA